MRKTSILIRVCFTSFAVSISALCGTSTHAFSELSTSERSLKEYYGIIKKISADSYDSQILILQNLLEENEGFERIYHKLLERYIVSNRIEDAIEYFTELTRKSRHQRNSLWMLAKIYVLQNKPDQAFRNFYQALNSGSPSLLLLKDFIEFDHQQSGQFNVQVLIQNLSVSNEFKRIAFAFVSHQNRDYDNAVTKFSGITNYLSHAPLLLHILGDCFYRSSRYNAADSLWKVGLAYAQRSEDLKYQSQFLSNLGVIEKAFGNYELALDYYNSALKISESIDYQHLKQLAAGNIGNLNYMLGDYSKAEKYYKNAIEIASNFGAYGYSSVWYSGYFKVLSELGRFNYALQIFDEAEEHSRKANKPIRLIRLKFLKASFYADLNQNVLAKRILEETYKLARELKIKEYELRASVKLADLMTTAKGFKNYNEVRKTYEKYVQFLNKKQSFLVSAYWIAKIGTSYKEEGKYDLAKKEFIRAYEMAKKGGSKLSMAWKLLEIANIDILTKKMPDAFQKINNIIEIAKSEDDRLMLTEAYLSCGMVYQGTGELDKAISIYKRAVEIVEDARESLKVEQFRIGYFSNTQKVYRKLAQCYLARYECDGNYSNLDSLFYALEMSKARALQDLKVGNRISVNSEEYDEYLKVCKKLSLLLIRWRDQTSKFATTDSLDLLMAQIEATQYSILAQRMRLTSATIEESSPSISPPPLAAVQKQLKQNELGLLLYHIDEEGSFVMAVKGDDIKVKRLSVTPNFLEASIDSFITPFHQVNEDLVSQVPFKAAIANRLYELLVKPVEKFNLPERLLIVRDIKLMNLPFEILLTETPYKTDYTPKDEPDYADYFLVNRYSMVYSPSASLQETSSKSVVQNPDVLIFANPFVASPNSNEINEQFTLRTGMRFDPLLHSEIEANRIKDAYSNTIIYKREKATSLNFLEEAPKYQNVHLATHAFANTTFDAFSGLVLAATADSADDGILMGYEIADLKLKSELVTLSACETGRGKLVAGEGVLGLPRLFLGAGAKSVLMTHWKVDDKFASEMMPMFYSYYLGEGLSKGDALANAKREILGRSKKEGDIYYQHPFYWASFTLYGDPGQDRSRLSNSSLLALISGILIVLVLGLSTRFAKKRKMLKH